MERKDAPDEQWVPPDTFGARLAVVRQHMKMNVLQMAKLCGLPPATWYTWEDGTTPHKLDRVVTRIVEATGVDRDWLMWGGPLRSRCSADDGLLVAS